jgi:hypothetical protein
MEIAIMNEAPLKEYQTAVSGNKKQQASKQDEEKDAKSCNHF